MGPRRLGKNGYVLFESEMYRAMRSRHGSDLDLQAAVGSDRFFLQYQPIFKLADMTVIGVEALLRWNHPRKGVLQPDDFIPALEASGLDGSGWSLGDARGLSSGNGVEGHRPGHQDVDQCVGPPTRCRDAARRRLLRPRNVGLPPRVLIVEITETCLMRDARGALQQLNALKSLGVRIAIDDFGTGYSSLAYLQQFPVDSLKIDRSFISGMGKSPEGDSLIHTLIQLGKALNLETLAEGIEEDGQLVQLRGEKCDVGQGYLFARPVEPEEIELDFMSDAETFA